MARTIIDLIIFDRITYIKSTFPEFPLQSLRIAAEYTLSFPSAVDNTKTVSGKADYVLGYGGSSSKELGTILVATEAKRQSTFSRSWWYILVHSLHFATFVFLHSAASQGRRKGNL
ncbi:hypothetical protein BDD12DRAFT_805928 [Trichophaea hybrida]|nr:hypothetical protein BDD12DRAFT_805928 [Trichophaea hybrida]